MSKSPKASKAPKDIQIESPEKTPSETKASGGRPPYRRNDLDEGKVRALSMFGASIKQIAMALSIDPKTLTKHYSEIIHNAQMTLFASSMATIGRALSSNDENLAVNTAKYVLSTKGKAYGWSLNQRIEEREDPFGDLDMKKLDRAQFKEFRFLLEKMGAKVAQLPEDHELLADRESEEDED